jgi:D-glycero-D-manno-heptose 1,7-bisphosphate phosphatase
VSPLSAGLFLDRDGTINVERGYLSNPDEVELLPGAARAIRAANEFGLPVIVITNQAGVARGYHSEADVNSVNARLQELLKAEGARIDALYYCPHHPEVGDPPYRIVCSCRKPGTGMLKMAEKALGINLASSFVVGDKCSDIETGKNAGSGTVLVLTGYGRTEIRRCTGNKAPDHVADDLPAAWEFVKEYLNRKAMTTS